MYQITQSRNGDEMFNLTAVISSDEYNILHDKSVYYQRRPCRDRRWLSEEP